MKKIGILLGIFIVIGSITQANAQCWIDKKDGYNFEAVGKIRPNSNEDCYTPQVIAVAAYLLLLDEEATTN